MSDDPANPSTPYSKMPPVAAPGDASPPPQRESGGWHKPIGIVSIVLGVCGFVGGCMHLLSPLFMPFFEEFMRAAVPKGQPTGMEAISSNSGRLVAQGAMAAAAAALLVAAGIGLAKQRRWGAKLSVTWSVVKMIVVVATLLIAWPMQKASLEAMQQNAAGGQFGSGFYTMTAVLSIGFGLLWGWAYPVFLLIWFGRRKIKDQIATWE